jgi:hypothetical protein
MTNVWIESAPGGTLKTGFDVWANSLTVIGFFITLAGIAIAVWQAIRSRNASERAADAADQAWRAAARVGDAVVKMDSISICSQVLALIEDVKRFQRDANWFMCLERYSSLRQHLIALRTISNLAPDPEMLNIQLIVGQVQSAEKKIEIALADPTQAPNIVRLNEVLTNHTDKIQTFKIQLQKNLKNDLYEHSKTK